jgi:FkbH-like protein
MASDPQALLRQAMAAQREGRAEEALALLRQVADPHDAFARQNQCARLAKAIAPQLTGLPGVRVAVLAGSTVDPLVDLLGLWLLLAGFRLEAYNAPFNAWRQQAMDPLAGLDAFGPDFVWFFLTARDLRLPAEPGEADAAALRDVLGAVECVAQRLKVPVFVNNAEAVSIRVLGNLEGSLADALAGRIAAHNKALASALPAGCTLFDLAHQAAQFGLRRWEDARLWFHSKHPFALDAFGPVAFAGARLVAAARGRSRKCVVLDLDNTLWGGIVGDDGAEGIRIGASGGATGEAFAAFQAYLKALSRRGVALAVCSKNDDTLAREPFRSRSEMVLGLDDFAVFSANWSNKADNIRAIAAAMNIGTDALVFVDDNPAERAQVRAELPEVAVVEMPEDPSDYVAAVAAGGWFETLALSDEDRLRAKAYRDNAARTQALGSASDIDAYLRDLDMHAQWGLADATRLPRMAQLLNKTNQFQLTDRRFAEAELAALATDPSCWVGWFSLRDRFGEHGLISVVVVRTEEERAHIDAWAMSCRVFSRGMEDLTFAVLQRELAARGVTQLVGRYVPSAKNGVVAGLYERLGGQRDTAAADACWHFDLAAARPAATIFISETRASDAPTPAGTSATP